MIDRLPDHLAARFRRFVELRENEFETMERMFRAMIERNEDGFVAGLEELHSGANGRMSCLLQLSKIARNIRLGRSLIGDCFTREEGEALWDRFSAFDRTLQVDEPYLIPGFQTKDPTTYNFNEMPAMDQQEFIATW